MRRRERRTAVASVPAVVVTAGAGAVAEAACSASPRVELHRLAVWLRVVTHACRKRRACHLRARDKVVLFERLKGISQAG